MTAERNCPFCDRAFCPSTHGQGGTFGLVACRNATRARAKRAEAEVERLRDYARQAHEHGWDEGRRSLEADQGALISHHGSEADAWEGFAE